MHPGDNMSDVARDCSGEGSARRWRERRLRSWLRHERLAIRMAVAARLATGTEEWRCGGG